MALLAVEGVYRDGMVELDERPPGLAEARVIVTFLPESANGVQGGEVELKRRQEAGDRLLARLEAGIDFGGEKFNREEIYAERLDRIAGGDR
jgi:hypothetical protein